MSRVSGAVKARVGEMLESVSKDTSVLLITRDDWIMLRAVCPNSKASFSAATHTPCQFLDMP